jgi:hypothetical protein
MKSATMSQTTDTGILSPLGKPTEYRADYAPELLYPLPRQLKRDDPAHLLRHQPSMPAAGAPKCGSRRAKLVDSTHRKDAKAQRYAKKRQSNLERVSLAFPLHLCALAVDLDFSSAA